MACIKETYKLPIKIITTINIMLINLGTPVASIVLISAFFKDNFGIDTFITKIVMGIIFLIIVIKFPQVQKIKFLATPIFVLFTSIFLCIISNYVYLIVTDYENFQPKEDCKFGNQTDRHYFRWEHITLHAGIVMFTMNSISFMFPIRNAMKEPRNMTKVTISAYTFFVPFLLSIGILGYTVYGDDTKQTAFYCYSYKHDIFFYISECLFMLFLSIFSQFYIITMFEPLEYLEFYRKFLTNPDGTISTDRVILIRSIGSICIVSVSFLTEKLSDVSEFKGNF